MATNDDITSCTVCFEDFDLAVHVPRILPCLHSLCDVCLENLCRAPGRNHIQCPECRVQHKTDGSGAKKFPQNKYIISFLHQKQQNLSNASSPTYRYGIEQMSQNSSRLLTLIKVIYLLYRVYTVDPIWALSSLTISSSEFVLPIVCLFKFNSPVEQQLFVEQYGCFLLFVEGAPNTTQK